MRGGGPKSIALTDFASARCTTPATSAHRTRRSSKKLALTDFASTARPAKASKHGTFANEDRDLAGFDLSCEISTADQKKNRGLTGHIPIDQIAPGVFRSECPWCPKVRERSTQTKLTKLPNDHFRRNIVMKHTLFEDGPVSPCHQNLRKTNMVLSLGGSVLFALLVTEKSSLTQPLYTHSRKPKKHTMLKNIQTLLLGNGLWHTDANIAPTSSMLRLKPLVSMKLQPRQKSPTLVSTLAALLDGRRSPFQRYSNVTPFS